MDNESRTSTFSASGGALTLALSVCLFLMAVSSALRAQGMPFPPSPNGLIPGGIYPAGQGPVGVGFYGPARGATYRFTGTVDQTNNTAIVHWVSPSGWLYNPHTYATGFDPSAVAYGYLDKSGYPFMVVTNHFDDNFRTFKLSPNLTFNQTSMVGSGLGPVDLVFADFNKDGNSDIAVINDNTRAEPGSPSLSIFLGNGDGTFHNSSPIPLSFQPLSLATGDFNGDGKVDMVVAGYSNASSSGILQLFIGIGDGTFQAPTTINAGHYPASVVVFDFNEDGHADLGAVDYITSHVEIFLGNGDGTFKSPQNFSANGGPFSITAGDINGDGNLDLAVANFNTNDVSILFGNGDGTFKSPQNIAVGNGPVSIAVGDFNNDGKPDLMVANFYDNTISTLMNATGCPSSNLFHPTPPAGNVGTAYSESLAAGGLSSSPDYVVSAGALPAGLSLSNAGVLAGTPTSAGTGSFTVTGLVSNGCPGAENYTLAIHGATTQVQVNSGGANTAITMGGAQPVEVGFATVTVNSGTTPYATAVFSLKQNGFVVSEAGVPASPPTLKGEFFVDLRTIVPDKAGHDAPNTISVDTGVAAVNRGNATANITYTLRDTAGNELTTGHGTLAVNAHYAKFIDQLNTVASGFNLPANFATATQFGSLTMTSDQPLSILALRLTINQRGDILITTTPIADLTQSLSSGTSYFPQLANGGGWTTKTILLNTSAAIETGQLRIYGDDGSPLTVGHVGGTTNSTFPYSIPIGGVFTFQTDGAPANAVSGEVQLIPDAATKTPVGAGVFSFAPYGTLVTEAGIPASTPTTHALIYIDTSGGHLTGLALANPGGATQNITLNAYQKDGATFAGLGSASLAANGHKAAFMDSFVTGLPNGFTGVLDLSSPTPFVALTLRALDNGRDQIYTTLPVADLTQPAPSPIVFPQIADGIGGGQYQTQFILLSAGGAAGATLNFFGDDGAPLSVGKSGRGD